MKIKDTKAIRLYGPYYDWGQHWIARTPEGETQNFKDPIDLALWLEKRAQSDPGPLKPAVLPGEL